MLYATQEPATGKLTQAELDDYIEPWHLPHYICQLELERKQRDRAAAPAEAAHPVTDYCHSGSQEATAGDGAGLVLWPLAVILAIGTASFLAWALGR